MDLKKYLYWFKCLPNCVLYSSNECIHHAGRPYMCCLRVSGGAGTGPLCGTRPCVPYPAYSSQAGHAL